MTFLRYRKWIVMAAGFFFVGFVVWPYVQGSRSSLKTEFAPINEQILEVIAQRSDDTMRPDVPEAPDEKGESTPKETQTSVRKSTEWESREAKPNMEASPSGDLEESPAETTGNGLLDLNAATLQQLNELPGIGDSKARAIMDYRVKKGKFTRIEELIEVKGIGEKLLEKLKEHVFVPST
ncbi:ComEA family DNA-binding protein [Paenibacillus sp. GCM10023248]|uniref:ComEA family DNA-binding protein n=1 Tax=Bacillales TaxID=1385 RepID=UPI0023792D16|nr:MULTISPECIES: helix-hairpin-helix domain-containing protein [Bacillales]MDD9268726.1 helix-hairpin-helix domain-containing protein [Paenibacillus sp. MAHUQ-63]MDR6880041.1 competence protein ComEA [Bacillus sp. 3255]